MKPSNFLLPFSIIVAIDEQRGIGKANSLPWHIKADMQHFKEITTKTQDPNKLNACIMGRNTWESIPKNFRPLPDRVNIILSRKPSPQPSPTNGRGRFFETRQGNTPSAKIGFKGEAPSGFKGRSPLEDDFSVSQSFCFAKTLRYKNLDTALAELNKNTNVEKIFVIGGAQVYKEAILHSQCQNLYVTKIKGDFNCDTFFPEFEDRFKLVKESTIYKEMNIEFKFTEYLKHN